MCISVHESWAQIPLVLIKQEIHAKTVLNWNMWCQGAVGDSSAAEGWLWRKPYLYMHIKHNIHRDNASVIVSYPRTVAPLHRTRLDKVHVHRLVVCVCMKYTRKTGERIRFLVIIDNYSKCGC